MNTEKNRISILESDFNYWCRFEKYIREFKSEIYEDAYKWAKDKNNLPSYPDKTLLK
tara:strand:+ start:209 stop:379 length:171 start_codon:yes stop_codon:yes gene_type:complete